jgi:hypothetical protein
MNSGMRAIDLSCQILAPLASGLLMTYAGARRRLQLLGASAGAAAGPGGPARALQQWNRARMVALVHARARRCVGRSAMQAQHRRAARDVRGGCARRHGCGHSGHRGLLHRRLDPGAAAAPAGGSQLLRPAVRGLGTRRGGRGGGRCCEGRRGRQQRAAAAAGGQASCGAKPGQMLAPGGLSRSHCRAAPPGACVCDRPGQGARHEVRP